jgi:YkoY family integral membrane protein
MDSHLFIVLLNLFILEALLSIDNAAVLAIMVKDLPPTQRVKALRYGLLGAYAFRFLCLFIASWLIKILWLKIVGGVYLLFLAYGHFFKKEAEEAGNTSASDSKIFKFLHGKIGVFWSTIFLVEIMDLAFSIDNVFAAVALSDNMYVIMAGVGIGILAMRFVAGWFSKLIERYPSLEPSAFVVIALLGAKLVICGVLDYIPYFTYAKEVINTHAFDLVFSGLMMLIFFIPILRPKTVRA